MTKTIVHVVGARPNFMKIAPLMEAHQAGCRDSPAPGEHRPALRRGHGEGLHSRTAAARCRIAIWKSDRRRTPCRQRNVMIRFEAVCLEERPDLIVVVGDVNSTMAAALVGAKLLIPVAHVEAGLRSYDRTMPEEINRIVTDRLADILLTPSSDGNENLLREGVRADRIHLVGNIMIDTLFRHLPAAEPRSHPRSREGRRQAVRGADAAPPVERGSRRDLQRHPRSGQHGRPRHAGRVPRPPEDAQPDRRARDSPTLVKPLTLTEPLGYIDFLSLTSHARIVLTDSGGLQEESTALGIPCLTLRENTERPITVTHGTNRVVGHETRRHSRRLPGRAGPGRRAPHARNCGTARPPSASGTSCARRSSDDQKREPKPKYDPLPVRIRRALKRPPEYFVRRAVDSAARRARRPWSHVVPAPAHRADAARRRSAPATSNALWDDLAQQPFFVQRRRPCSRRGCVSPRGIPRRRQDVLRAADAVLRHEFDLLGIGAADAGHAAAVARRLQDRPALAARLQQRHRVHRARPAVRREGALGAESLPALHPARPGLLADRRRPVRAGVRRRGVGLDSPPTRTPTA